MLQTTKASAVAPISLYLWGMFFHGGQFQSKPISVEPPSSPNSSSESETELSISSMRNLTSTPSSVFLSLNFGFSFMLHKTLNFSRTFEGKRLKPRGLSWEWKTLMFCGGLVLLERKNKFCILSASFAISPEKKQRNKGGYSIWYYFSGEKRKTKRLWPWQWPCLRGPGVATVELSLWLWFYLSNFELKTENCNIILLQLLYPWSKNELQNLDLI